MDLEHPLLRCRRCKPIENEDPCFFFGGDGQCDGDNGPRGYCRYGLVEMEMAMEMGMAMAMRCPFDLYSVPSIDNRAVEDFLRFSTISLFPIRLSSYYILETIGTIDVICQPIIASIYHCRPLHYD